MTTRCAGAAAAGMRAAPAAAARVAVLPPAAAPRRWHGLSRPPPLPSRRRRRRCFAHGVAAPPSPSQPPPDNRLMIQVPVDYSLGKAAMVGGRPSPGEPDCAAACSSAGALPGSLAGRAPPGLPAAAGSPCWQLWAGADAVGLWRALAYLKMVVADSRRLCLLVSHRVLLYTETPSSCFTLSFSFSSCCCCTADPLHVGAPRMGRAQRHPGVEVRKARDRRRAGGEGGGLGGWGGWVGKCVGGWETRTSKCRER